MSTWYRKLLTMLIINHISLQACLIINCKWVKAACTGFFFCKYKFFSKLKYKPKTIARFRCQVEFGSRFRGLSFLMRVRSYKQQKWTWIPSFIYYTSILNICILTETKSIKKLYISIKFGNLRATSSPSPLTPPPETFKTNVFLNETVKFCTTCTLTYIM